jgi:hypothetical protein
MTQMTTPTSRASYTPSPQQRLKLWREGYETLMREFDSFDLMLARLCSTSSSESHETHSTSLSSSPSAMPSEVAA